MADKVTANAISTIIANPNSPIQDPVIQVVDLKLVSVKSNRYQFIANDGKTKVKAAFASELSHQVQLGSIQNLGLIRLTGYTVNDIQKFGKCLMITNFEIVTPVLEMEIGTEVKKEEQATLLKPKQDVGIQLKPKREIVAKSAAEIVLDEGNGNKAPSARMSMTRRVFPIVSLNPYQGNWTIEARVTNKGTLRTYNNAKGEGHVFNVELTDQDGTQIQATMFNAAAEKFYSVFEMGKVYYISKGSLRVANKKYVSVNEYEMTLNENSIVEEVTGETPSIPKMIFNFVQIGQLASYVTKKGLVDVIGVVQNVSETMSFRRKADETELSKRDITIADDSKKTVVVSLWNDLATSVGQELLDAVQSGRKPIVAIKYLKVGDYQGVSLSTLSKSTVMINPDVPESKKLRSWYESEGKEATMELVGTGLDSNSSTYGTRSMYSDRVLISDITSNPSMGEGNKSAFVCVKAYINHIKHDQPMWYRACKDCRKKVTGSTDLGGYYCDGCQKNVTECSLRYAMTVKAMDTSGQAWFTVFNDQAEKILGYPADELDIMRQNEGDQFYPTVLAEAKWVPRVFRVGVAPSDYQGEKRQRITVKTEAPVDFVAESKFLLDEMEKMSKGSVTA